MTSGGMWAAISGISSVESIQEITLNRDDWTGNGPFIQEVSLQGVTAASKIDIQADAAAISQLLSDGVRAVWVENNNGTVTVYSIGAAPTEDITLQCSIENITSPYQYDSVPTENSTNLVLSGGVWSALQNISVESDSALSGSSENPVQNKVIYEALAGKVDTVAGKGLSENDYTTAEKQKLAGIEAGANKTVVDSSLSSSSLNPVQNKVIYEALQSFVTSWQDLTGKPSTLEGYGITVDTAPTENSTNPVSSGGIYNAVHTKENTSNKKTEITAASTDTDYPSAKAVWDLFFSFQTEIAVLKSRVDALEHGEMDSAIVEDNILVLQNGQMNGTILEPVGVTIGQDNILTFGQSSESVTADMENNILTLGNVSMDSNILTINDDVMDGTTMEF